MPKDKLAGIFLTAALLMLPVTLTACGDAEQSGEEPGGQAQEEPETGNGQQESESTGAMELTEAGDEAGGTTGGNGASGAPETAAGEPAEARDGTWSVGDAGEIDFTLGDGGLTLDDVRPNQGWESEIDEQSPDEIEVDFERDNVEWQIEVETQGSELEIEIDQTIEPAEPGTYEIADAGIVEFAIEGGALSLADASANEGWNVSVDEETAEEIEVEFTRNGVRWDFDAELDDGELEVEVDQDITGPLPN